MEWWQRGSTIHHPFVERFSSVLSFVCYFSLHRYEVEELHKKLIIYGTAAGAAVFGVATASGLLWDMSVRVRALFIKHTKTGNPLVDSVAEHQATSGAAYWTYFHCVVWWMVAGVVMTIKGRASKPLQASFLLLYFGITFYFSSKMVRLILLLAPPGAIAGGVSVSRALSWTYGVLTDAPAESNSNTKPDAKKNKKQKAAPQSLDDMLDSFKSELGLDNPGGRRTAALGLAAFLLLQSLSFSNHAITMSNHLSEPQIMMQGRAGADGQRVIIDDFREAYWYLRDSTPEDSRVMAWWDYGYQINGVGNRTTIADGNTWNHEHIALLGRCLVSNEEESHNLVKHLADYVLVWSTRVSS